MKHLMIMAFVAAFFVAFFVACSGGNAPAPAPDRATVDAMRSFCKLEATPFEQRGLAMAHWVESSRKSPAFAATWGAMIKGNKAARVKIEAAADVAVGKGKCDILESFGKP